MREEENYVQRSYKSDSDRRQKDWRRQPDFNPVHDKRQAAEADMRRMENELKTKLLEIRR